MNSIQIRLALTVLSLTTAFVSCGSPEIPKQTPSSELIIPNLKGPNDPSSDKTTGTEKYIVVYKDEAQLKSQGLTAQNLSAQGLNALTVSIAGLEKTQIKQVYQTALKGAAIDATEAQAKRLKDDPRVAFVEKDGLASIDATQTSSPWGLDRIDQRGATLDQKYTYDTDGTGVNAYVIDTGIRFSHQEFEGRARLGFNAIGDPRNSAGDCLGHGTHVAGTIAGKTYGVAKKANLIAVNVFPCDGGGFTAISNIIAGIDWVTRNHVKPAVVNMSISGGASDAQDLAVRNSINAGITYVIAAGNLAIDAGLASPARVTQAITVGASDSNNARANFSNFGGAVDVFAPGVNILSAYHTSDSATAGLAGTSMASPHVAGAVARFLQNNRTATPAQAEAYIVNNATPGVITDLRGSPNRLLFTPYTPTPQAAQRALGWVWTDQENSALNVPYSPAAAYQFNRNYSGVPATNSVTRLGVGQYRVDFKNFLVAGGTAHVTAYGGNHTCKVLAWSGEVALYVNCFAPNGQPVNGKFSAMFYKDDANAPTDRSNAYIWNDKANAPLGCETKENGYQFNSKRSPIQICRNAEGSYTAFLHNMRGGTVGKLGTVQITAYGADSTRCHVGNWGFAGESMMVPVYCFKGATPTNSQFTLSYSREAGQFATVNRAERLEAWHAYHFNNNQSYPDQSNNSYGAPFAAADASYPRFTSNNGEYQTFLPGVKAYGSSNVQITAFTQGLGKYCNVMNWQEAAGGTQVNTQCFNSDGSVFPLNPGHFFNVLYQTDQAVRN
jgi:subtilisin family serine protease